MKPVRKMAIGYIIGGLLVLIIVPSLIYSLTVLADRIYQISIIQNKDQRLIISVALLITGFSFGISSIIYQNVVGKGGPLEISNIEISPKTRNLVTSGPYRLTRNPMLFGTILIYLAGAILLNSLAAVLIVLIFAAIMLTVVVKREEERLLKDFGNQYVQYRNRTSKIIPWFPFKANNSDPQIEKTAG
jgi:protein-S-isoprenylcysteine O-methyltransferase Ste14